MPKQYTPELKTQVMLSYQNGLPLPDIIRKYQIAQSTLYRWIKGSEINDGQHTVADYAALQRRNMRLEHLLQITRLCGIIDAVPLRQRLEILAQLHEQFEQYSVHELCEALNVARGTFYNHIFRLPGKARRGKRESSAARLRAPHCPAL